MLFSAVLAMVLKYLNTSSPYGVVFLQLHHLHGAGLCGHGTQNAL